jgi:malto-oligosyltrehalose trehalohydrolase
MAAEPGGWFSIETNAVAGDRYRYRLDDAYSVPDPAGRALFDDVHGWSVVVDPLAYAWRAGAWAGRPWEETVIYEAHPGVFGGFSGLEHALPKIAALGVTAVELMPVADFPGSRNWGYDGVFLFAPDTAYGPPEALKSLVDTAHSLGLMVFLDVVYNHFGPDGNFLPRYAPQFFTSDRKTEWGDAVNLRRAEVRQFFVENALYWLQEFQVDGLRLDAVHALRDPDLVAELGGAVRAATPPGRRVHLVVENDDNDPSLLRGPFDAQWNDDFHHVLHVLLTGETGGYYADYAAEPSARLARLLLQGFDYQGDASTFRNGLRRGAPSDDLPPTAFVNFLQNHDQVGNRAFGERLTRLADPRALEAAIVLLLLAPAVPLIFMGEESASETPFLYFTDHDEDLAAAVREGRRREFADTPDRIAEHRLKDLPDPNAVSTFDASHPLPGEIAERRKNLYRTLLRLRKDRLAPRLKGATALGSRPLGPRGACATWRLGDGSVWSIAVNLGPDPVDLGQPLNATAIFAIGDRPPSGLGPFSAVVTDEALV